MLSSSPSRGVSREAFVSVVIPTYNEAEIISSTLDEVVKALEASNVDYEIIVVDDDSPDGTWKIVEEYSAHNGRVRLLRRIRERGLASAILDGIKAARGDYVIVMDADLQHPPKFIPKLIEAALKENADVVVASRYTSGGGVAGWSRLRYIMSRGATIAARILVGGARKTSDPMSGFFLIRREAIISEIDNLKPRGFKVLLEILTRINGLKVVDVPYIFEPRKAGRSKLGINTIIDYILHIVRLSEVVKFAIVGASGTIINLSTMYFILYIIGVSKRIASILGIEAGLIWNFIFNETWTFRGGFQGPWWKRLLAYHASTAGGFIVTFITMEVLSSFLGINPILAQFIGIIFGFIVNYLASSRGVWRLGRGKI